MADLKHLASRIKELEDQLVVCMHCGMCQAVCPVFAETGREADVTRGKLALLDGLVQELFQNPQRVNAHLMRCLLCGSCSANCPSGVKVLDIFIKARAILTAYLGLSPLKRAIFRGMLVRPGFFDRLLEWGSKLQGLFIKPVDDLLGTSCGRWPPFFSDRHLKALAPTAFHQMVKPMDTDPGSSGVKVAFFVGCIIDKVFPHIGKAVLRCLEHHGVGVYLPEGFACCGIPVLSSGDTFAFNRLVRYNLQRFTARSFDVLLTPCATCTSTIKKLWPLLAQEFSPDVQQQVAAIAEKTMDVSQFLVDNLGVCRVDSKVAGQKVLLTYHDPCHLKKSLNVATQPRTLLHANPRYHFKEMVEADRCCGMGGSFNLQHYDLSAAIGRRKRDNIVQSGCEIVATSCPACMLQIMDMLSRAGDRIQVRHTIEVYAESLI